MFIAGPSALWKFRFMPCAMFVLKQRGKITDRTWQIISGMSAPTNAEGH